MGRYRTVETEKEEQSYEARIWWAFWIVSIVVIAYTAWHQYRNYNLVHTGTCIEAKYQEKEGIKIATYHDENGNQIASYTLNGLSPVLGDGTVKLYYKDNIHYAEPQTDIRAWLGSYIIFGLVLIGCSWKLKTIYSRKASTQAYDSEY